eukprot:6191930-Pleurochrysis_carterae.AAC.5
MHATATSARSDAKRATLLPQSAAASLRAAAHPCPISHPCPIPALFSLVAAIVALTRCKLRQLHDLSSLYLHPSFSVFRSNPLP